MLIISQPFTGSIEYADPDCGCVMPTPPGGARPLPPQRPGDGGGKPAYATCVSRSDANEGWRDYRREGGLVVDLRTNEIVCEGLSMPHSPRLYQNRLWLLNSGSGEFGYVDRERGVFEPVAFCPGYARGLAFLGDFALVGLSKL